MNKDSNIYLEQLTNSFDVIFSDIESLENKKILILKQLREDNKNKIISNEQFEEFKKEVNILFEKKLKELKEIFNLTTTVYCDQYTNSSDKSISPNKLKLIALLVIPLVMTFGLIINYTIVGKPNFSNKTELSGFIFSMVIVFLVIVFLFFYVKKSSKKMIIDREVNAFKSASIGFIAAFFDTLGIGSFATSTTMLKSAGYIKNDKVLPGTLNSGLWISLFSGALFIGAVDVEIITLISFIFFAIIGSMIGPMLVKKVNTQFFQLAAGILLAITAIIMLFTVKGIELLPSGSKTGVFNIWYRFIPGCLAFLVLGILMSFGIGLYAPAMAVIALLGMDFLVVFPIISCTAGISMQVNTYKYYKQNNYLPKTSFCMMIGAICGIVACFTLVFAGIGSIPGVDMNIIKEIFKWLSVPAIGYASFLLLKDYVTDKKDKKDNQDNEVEEIILDYNSFEQSVEKVIEKSINLNWAYSKIELEQYIKDKNLILENWIK